MSTEQRKIPAGYWENAKGALIPVEMIKEIDLERDELVRDIVEQAKNINNLLREAKQKIFADIQAFVELSAEQYQVSWGGKKGNIQLVSFDGKYKILRAISDRISFDERLIAAKSLIDECLNEWVKDARPEIHAIISEAFNTDQQGKINTGKVLELRRLKIDDERWQKAMQAIGESVQVIGSSAYIRVYERIGETAQYQQISLDMSGV